MADDVDRFPYLQKKVSPLDETGKAIARREFLVGAGATGLTAALASCGGAGGGANVGGGGDGDGTERVTLILDVAPYGKHSPFFVAQHKGFWKKRGLAVNINHGSGSADTVTKVGAGARQIAFADTSAQIQGRANQNVKAKLVCMYHYENLMSAIGIPPDIKRPKDLVGKKMITTPGDADLVMLPALADINNFNVDDVEIIFGDHPSQPAAVASGEADGSLNFFTAYPAFQVAARKAQKQPSYLLYANHGVDVYNNGIFVTEGFLNNSADQVRAFTAGFVEAVMYTVANPDEAVQIFRNNVPGVTANLVKAQQQVAINHLYVSEVEEHGFGPMNAEKMRFTLDMVNEYFDLDQPVNNVDSIYTNDYVPEGKVPDFQYREPKVPKV